ncbi:MAG TPA: 5-formyltetrahydrofolate cyclo-ligase [Burkholderiaceae bacterium]|nr:5-formyltetrahydrofolate cyclo-ligase [Burkholderiaceae bacterium]
MDSRAHKKLQRARLTESRDALIDREKLEAAVQRRVAEWLQQADVHALGFYFPIQGEPDLRAVIAAWLTSDSRRVAALPVIDGKVLAFRAWTADSPMRAGEFGIPVPAQGRTVQPECLLIPCLGFDEQRFRLGYGGGYYDRTLAALIPFPLVVGVAFEAARLQTIGPQPHDIKMDVVITEAAVY